MLLLVGPGLTQDDRKASLDQQGQASKTIHSTILSTLCLHVYAQEKLTEFILACQDSETGGFTDRPGDWVSEQSAGYISQWWHNLYSGGSFSHPVWTGWVVAAWHQGHKTCQSSSLYARGDIGQNRPQAKTADLTVHNVQCIIFDSVCADIIFSFVCSSLLQL